MIRRFKHLALASAASLTLVAARGDDDNTTPAPDLIEDTTADAAEDTRTDATPDGDISPGEDLIGEDTAPERDTEVGEDTPALEDVTQDPDDTAESDVPGEDVAADTGEDTADSSGPEPVALPWSEGFELPSLAWDTTGDVDDMAHGALGQNCGEQATSTLIAPGVSVAEDALPLDPPAGGNQILGLSFFFAAGFPFHDPGSPRTQLCEVRLTPPVRLEPGRTYRLTYAARLADFVPLGAFDTTGSVFIRSPVFIDGVNVDGTLSVDGLSKSWDSFELEFSVEEAVTAPTFTLTYNPPVYTVQSGAPRTEAGTVYIDNFELSEVTD